jgi:hypothetical protein
MEKRIFVTRDARQHITAFAVHTGRAGSALSVQNVTAASCARLEHLTYVQDRLGLNVRAMVRPSRVDIIIERPAVRK